MVGTIYKATSGKPNSFGGSVQSVDSAQTIKLRLQSTREDLEFRKGGRTYIVRRIAYTTYDVNIFPGDYLYVDTTKYLILGVEDESGEQHHLKLYLYKL